MRMTRYFHTTNCGPIGTLDIGKTLKVPIAPENGYY